jgi:hypothetical protein
MSCCAGGARQTLSGASWSIDQSIAGGLSDPYDEMKRNETKGVQMCKKRNKKRYVCVCVYYVLLPNSKVTY